MFGAWVESAADDEGRRAILQGYLESSREFLAFYLRAGYRGYEHQLRRVAESADLVVDGMQPIPKLAAEVIEAVNAASNRSVTQYAG